MLKINIHNHKPTYFAISKAQVYVGHVSNTQTQIFKTFLLSLQERVLTIIPKLLDRKIPRDPTQNGLAISAT